MSACDAYNLSGAPPGSADRPEVLVSALHRAAAICGTSAGGNRIVWRIWGKGRPLVLLHGNFGSWTHWIRNIPALARSHTVIAPDLPGFGDSDMPSEARSAADLGALLHAGYRELGVSDDPVSLVGFSLGSTLAGAMARSMGPGARKLIVVSAGQIGVRRENVPRLHAWRKLATTKERMQAHAANLRAMMLHDPDALDDLAVHIQSSNASRARLDTRSMTASHPLREILFSLNCQISGIWGGKDATIGPYIQDRLDLMAALGASERAMVVPDAGHWVQYEAEQGFNAALLDLLEIDAPGEVA